MPSSNVAVITLRPNMLIDRSPVLPGRLFSCCSSGLVTWASTSSAACPGQSVITCVWTSSTSGNASTGTCR